MLMNFDMTIQRFAENFLVKSYRDRFIHEVKKKRTKIATRLSHHLDEIFPDKYRMNVIDFDLNLEGYLFLSSEFELLKWCEAKNKIDEIGGGGWLFISITGEQFYANAEGEPSKLVYCGNSGTT